MSEKSLSHNDLCSMNIFALHPQTLALLKNRLDNFKEQHKGDKKAECLLPAELAALIKQKNIAMKVYPAEERWTGLTNPEEEEVVRSLLKEQY